MRTDKIISYRKAGEIAKKLRLQGKKIIFKSGCFDIFHVGHSRALGKIKQQADVLFVGVGTDKTLRILKGEGRPVFPEKYRAELISHLEVVDYVVILEEPLVGRIDHEKILSVIRPDYYSIPHDDKALDFKKNMAKKYSIRIKLQTPMKYEYTGEYISSTELFNRIKKWD